ncbi:NLR family, pyrin domain containing 4 isoform X1 [Rattus norvegicus]|uniref:NLR family, pyrin domain containing 4 n=2 Tax=Rattus norvegicus TaxID=10116 RepID=D3ZP31_RAT|nr:NLR family, pyrin domain containing 4 [Rattus norvegicus]XP_006228262.1 NLR family, pyrin domain containing 4 isoform X1 [Rattus norvegicus]XP_006228263.1 NLR family, pyrin domain containing 4 isoform X1 [Rattus norvegicus]XP_038942924.1 NLR family, pyrin domain containing 4 isoform X1 [Rattus norvegicus]|eukprot:NP_001165635.2 NLR family, pyrin domain containing 4 [Rattus norvegicus]
MASFFSDFGLMWYLEELNKKEFVKFKEFLKQEILQLRLKQISWTKVKKASREDLANLLLKHYEEKQAWDMTFKIFQKMNRKDLIERAGREIAGHSKLYQAHLKKKLTHDYARKFNIKAQDLFKQKFTQDDCDRFENLLVSKATGKKPHMVFLQGVAGIGKSLMLTKLMLAWSEGIVFQNKFSYIFYFCCQDVKQLKRASLAELISREWPNASAPTAEILSQPEKLLFIIDSLEVMECNMSERESELCDNCTEKQPVSLLLSSLLRRKMLPESSFLISATPETFEKMEDRIECTNVKIITGFNENNIKMYFRSLFQDKNRTLEAFSLVRENEQLFNVCQVPVLCWMVATCIKKEIEKGRDPVFICRRTTSLYTTHIFNLFTPQNAQYPSKKSQDQLQGLCSLAAEGMWTDTFVFSEEALRRNGILDSDIPTLLDRRILERSKESESCYIFLHPSLQEVCAAVFYLLKSHLDHPSQDVKSVEALLFTFLKKAKVQWIFLGCFLFGLLHESEQEKLEMFFGHQLSQEIKHQLYQCLETISVNEELQEQIDGMKLFYCLFEMEDEAFLMQAMNCMEQINFVAKDYSDVIVAAYCLKHCSTLKKLSFSTQNILSEEQEHSYTEKLLICWHHMCSVLISSKDIHVLQVKDTNLNETAFWVLYNHLKYPSCTLKVLVVNNVTFLCDNHLFFELIQNQRLQHLNLSLTFLSHSDVKLLCDVLNQAECNIEKLMIAACNLSPDDCKVFASVLISSKMLKHLNLSSNNLDKGISSLCKALCHPDCILKHLVLANCSLSEQCWDYLSEVVRRNKTLSHLDISSNDLKDEGLKVLCGALTLPDSGLISLSVRHCLITTSGCQDLAEVLRHNQNLRSLQVSNNKIEDAGVKLLCDAIKQPNCHLENIGLEACELTGACCKDLASAFVHCKTLWGINLLENALDHSGLVVLFEALKQQKCTLHVLGLRITDFDKETQEFLIAEEEKNPYLSILSNV